MDLKKRNDLSIKELNLIFKKLIKYRNRKLNEKI